MGGRGIQNPERSWILLHGQYILKHFVLGLIDTKNYLNVTTREQSQIVLSANQRRVDYFTLRKKLESAPYKGIQDCLGCWIAHHGFRIFSLDTGFKIFVSGTWIPDSTH